MRTDKGVWISLLDQSNYERMVEMRNQADGRSEQSIMDEVLGIRRGHHRGRGRKLPLSSSSSAPTSSKGKHVLMDNHIQSAFRQELSKYVKKHKAANQNMVFPENLDDDEEEEGTGTEDAWSEDARSEDTRSEEDETSDN